MAGRLRSRSVANTYSPFVLGQPHLEVEELELDNVAESDTPVAHRNGSRFGHLRLNWCCRFGLIFVCVIFSMIWLALSILSYNGMLCRWMYGFGIVWRLRYGFQCQMDDDGPFIARSATQPRFWIRTMSPLRYTHSHAGIHANGVWERHTYHDMRRALVDNTACVGQGPHFVDLGANIGFFSLYAVAAGCEVLAVDGSSEYLFLLRSSLDLNVNIESPEKRLNASKLKARQLYIGNSDTGLANYKYAGLRHTGVVRRKIDTLLAEEGLANRSWQLPMIKIDIETSINLALKGSAETLRRHLVKVWHVELWESVSYEWFLHNVVMQGYSGYFECCELRGESRESCSWKAHSMTDFAKASNMAMVWTKRSPGQPLRNDLCDTLFTSEHDAPLE